MKRERLNEKKIRDGLGVPPIRVCVYSEIDSTNTEAKRYAAMGGEIPCVFLAERQSAGRGRLGRSFYSPEGTGLYLSLLLPVACDLTDVLPMTAAAAVAVRRAVLDLTGRSLGIKWVNDLYLDGKKVCGILAESFLMGKERYLVIGVGINLYTEVFPEDLTGIAASLLPEEAIRNRLAARIVTELYRLWQDPRPQLFMEEYRQASVVLGHEVEYSVYTADGNGERREGIAESVDERGGLQIRHPDGTRITLRSGEISLRVKQKNTGNEV